MPKNYYLVLGITSEATTDDIKAAYRRLAKEFHPDHYGDNHSRFLAIQEAYSILSDPEKRYHHDRMVARQKAKQPPGTYTGTPVYHHNRAEPLIPDQKPVETIETISLARSFNTYRPSFDQLFDRILGNFHPYNSPKNEKIENLNLEILLTPEQAFTGGQVRISIPVEPVCPSCSGQGRIGPYSCRRCSGDGVISGEYPIIIYYPPHISKNHVVQIPLDKYGIHNLYLTVHFRTSEAI